MIIGVIGIEVLYLMTIYQAEKNIIIQSEEEIRLTKLRKKELETNTNQLPEIEKALELATSQKQAILNRIPTYAESSKNEAGLFRYMERNDFMSTEFKTIDIQEDQSQQDDIIQSDYELTFVGRYEDVMGVIEHLNQSYQVINIKGLTISNEVQNLEDEDHLAYYTHYGKDFPEVVQANIQLSMYSRYDALSGEQEVYQPDFDLHTNEESIFKWTQFKGEEKDEVTQAETIPPLSDTGDLFTLNVGDRNTAGDTYKLDGPGSIEGDYVGLTSNVSVEVKVEIYKDYYEMSIVDKEGLQEGTKVKMNITHPKMEIISTMRPLDKVMPNIHVCIYNHTDTVMDVQVTGSMQDHIYVFSGKERIGQGETKANVKLT